MMENKNYILAYIREEISGAYPGGLARSIHFAVCTDGKVFRALNRNYGMLFAEASISEDNTILPKALVSPQICSVTENQYAVTALEVQEDGKLGAEETAKLCGWITSDFQQFERIAEDSVIQRYRELQKTEIQEVQEQAKAPEGASAGCVIDIPAELAAALEQQIQMEEKQFHQKVQFPLAKGYGDPVIFFWSGKYYFIATNDNTDDIGLYVREAGSVNALFEEGIEEHLILGYDEERQFIQTFWAPEFHVIGGDVYLLFTISGEKWGPQCHMMRLKAGGSIINPEDWELPKRVQRMDGSWLDEEGITLDMTYFKVKEEAYVVWSGRRGIGTELDTGSMLYIAKTSEGTPWQLCSEPVLLSRPLYGWENLEHTINNEAPYALVTDDRVFLTYSGGDAVGYLYSTGLLTLDTDADPLVRENWKKRARPLVSFYSMEGVYGPGHSSFFRDETGAYRLLFHGEERIDSRLRCIGISECPLSV